jgi:hypothetical protein
MLQLAAGTEILNSLEARRSGALRGEMWFSCFVASFYFISFICVVIAKKNLLFSKRKVVLQKCSSEKILHFVILFGWARLQSSMLNQTKPTPHSPRPPDRESSC